MEIHPSIKRYADLSCALYVLGLSYDSLISRSLWEDPLNTLSLEMVSLLMKLASCVKENVWLPLGVQSRNAPRSF